MLAVGPAAVATRGSTIVGGLHVQAGVWAQGADASVALANTVVRAQSSGPDLLAGGGTITASSSAFTKVSSQGGGAAPAVGSGTNVAGDPQFVGPVTVDWPDFREARGLDRLRAPAPLTARRPGGSGAGRERRDRHRRI